MAFTKNKRILLSLCFIFIFTVIPISASERNPFYSIDNMNSPSSLSNVVSVEKRVNSTNTVVNEIILIEIILHNLWNTPIFNVTVSEDRLLNPVIETLNLIDEINYQKIDPLSSVSIVYTMNSSKAMIVPIPQTSVSYYLSESSDEPMFTAYSNEIVLNISEGIVKQNSGADGILIIYSFLISFYIILLLIRIMFKTKNQKDQNA